jgi:hypothetical protein
MNAPHITFGMIVLNGEPFVRYNLRALYAFAHQIIVVEGACPSASGVATPNGHSRDSTLKTLRCFQVEEDPEHKVIVVTAEDQGHQDGFWNEKDEMSQAYASLATGNYLWQVDCDEFYRSEDMAAVIAILANDPTLTAITFRTVTFWGGLEFATDSFVFRRGERDFHRLFAWKPGFTYSTHRPPTVLDEMGVDLRGLHWVNAGQLARRGIYLYHYALLFPKQVVEKCTYYTRLDSERFREANHWAQRSYFQLQEPFRVHHMLFALSWLNYYHGKHPAQVEAMVKEVADGAYPGIALRNNLDVAALLKTPGYLVKRALLIAAIPPVLMWDYTHKLLRLLLHSTPVWPIFQAWKKRTISWLAHR